MSVAIITGANGLIGSGAAKEYADRGYLVVGIDNDMRKAFFGPAASTERTRQRLVRDLGASYQHFDVDIRDVEALRKIFVHYGAAITVVVHAAGQPSHDWAAKEPSIDFAVNAIGTLNLLECVRNHAPAAPFIFMSTNKVYGDRPNALPFLEEKTRYELRDDHPFYDGITEDMAVDQCLHSIFGASKLSADVLTQEYGRYYGLGAVCLRGGTLTGPDHAAAELHGFLAYLVKCAVDAIPYTIRGYGGKQVRDAIHARDVVEAIVRIAEAPRPGEVYNIGGGRTCNISVLEAISLVQEITGREMDVRYDPRARVGDHLWWISSNSRLMSHYPGWRPTYAGHRLLEEILEGQEHALHSANY